ncbi:MAG: hypothetical protein IJ035_03415, partial [Oscillospiraceae bacterium]|nr:hypothetical protein [Oscillospiraceae bacterium]
MSESSSHFDYTYNVKDTDAALSFEFVYSPWSEERLNSYTYINNTTNGNIFDKLEEEIRCAVSVAGYSPYIRDNSLFSVAISPTDYKENYVLKVNGVEYDLVGYTETNLYESIKIWSDYSSYYFTDAIVVPENVSELIVTYESATKNEVAITTQPTDYTGAIGATATFIVKASGDNLTYQWQQNTGSGWANINTTAGRKASFSIGVTAARAKYQYRCVVSDGTTSVTSNAVKMVVKESLAITTQPTNYTGAIGAT